MKIYKIFFKNKKEKNIQNRSLFYFYRCVFIFSLLFCALVNEHAVFSYDLLNNDEFFNVASNSLTDSNAKKNFAFITVSEFEDYLNYREDIDSYALTVVDYMSFLDINQFNNYNYSSFTASSLFLPPALLTYNHVLLVAIAGLIFIVVGSSVDSALSIIDGNVFKSKTAVADGPYDNSDEDDKNNKDKQDKNKPYPKNPTIEDLLTDIRTRINAKRFGGN